MVLTKFSQAKSLVLDIMNKFLELPLTEKNRSDIYKFRENIKQEDFQVAVLSTWNTGKSTFINAIQGEPILPTQNKETTHIINRLKYSKDRYILLKFNRKSKLSIEKSKDLLKELKLNYSENREFDQVKVQCKNAVDQNRVLEIFSTDDGFLYKYSDLYLKVFEDELQPDFENFVEVKEKYFAVGSLTKIYADTEASNSLDEWINHSNIFKERCLRKIQNNLVEIEIGVPFVLCRDGVEIIDTPGAVSFDAMRDEIVYNYVKYAQCVIFIFRFDQPGATGDIKFKNIVDKCGIRDVFLLLNRIDLAKKPEEIYEAISQVKQNLKKFVKGEIFIYPVSSLGALLGKLSDSKNDYFKEFTKERTEFLEHNSEGQLKKYLDDLKKFFLQLDDYLTKVDKFSYILNSPLLFIERRLEYMAKNWEKEKKEKESNKKYIKFCENWKTIESIYDKAKRDKKKFYEELQMSIEGFSGGSIHHKTIEKINKAGELSKEDFEKYYELGFESIFDQLFTALKKMTTEECIQIMAELNGSQLKRDIVLPKFKVQIMNFSTITEKLFNDIFNNYTEMIEKQWKDYLNSIYVKVNNILTVPSMFFKSTSIPKINISSTFKSFDELRVFERIKEKLIQIFIRDTEEKRKKIENRILFSLLEVFKFYEEFYRRKLNENVNITLSTFEKGIEEDINMSEHQLHEFSKEKEKNVRKIKSDLQKLSKEIARVNDLMAEISKVRESLKLRTKH